MAHSPRSDGVPARGVGAGVCVLANQVWHSGGGWVGGELVHCLDVDSAVPVLVPAGSLFQDVELDVWQGAAESIQKHQCLGAEGGCCGLVELLCCYAEE